MRVPFGVRAARPLGYNGQIYKTNDFSVSSQVGGLGLGKTLRENFLAMQYPGIDGFLGTRASFMLDFVFLAMFLVIPIMGWSIYQVKFNRRYQLHKWVQIVLGIVLLVAVTLFEIDIRFYSGWRERAAGTPDGQISRLVMTVLAVHLFFAITTAVLWVFVMVQALRKTPNPPGPCAYSAKHIFWGKLAAADMFFTALTGWIFYLLAFVF